MYNIYVPHVQSLSFTFSNWMLCNLCIRNQILVMKTSKESWKRHLLHLMVYKLLLWLLRFWPKMATLKNVNVMFFNLTASHVHRHEQTACHLNLSEILFPTMYKLLIYCIWPYSYRRNYIFNCCIRCCSYKFKYSTEELPSARYWFSSLTPN